MEWARRVWCSRGSHCIGRCGCVDAWSSCRVPRATSTSRRDRVRVRSVRGLRRRASRSPIGPSWSAVWPRSWRAFRGTYRAPSSGVVGVWCPSRGSSGRDDRVVCTTASCIHETAPSPASPRDQGIQVDAASARADTNDSVCGVRPGPSQSHHNGLDPRTRGGSSICTPA